jgi:hypothetical protein
MATLKGLLIGLNQIKQKQLKRHKIKKMMRCNGVFLHTLIIQRLGPEEIEGFKTQSQMIYRIPKCCENQRTRQGIDCHQP